jgi:hypothetical protein
MAATATATTKTTAAIASTQLKSQTHQPTKPKRRKYRETTISSSAATATDSPGYHQTRKPDPPAIVSPDHHPWCCPASKTPPPPPPPPSPPNTRGTQSRNTEPSNSSPSTSPSSFRIRFSPGSQSPVMDFTPTSTTMINGHDSFPSSFTKFNSALTAGLLNPMSPPPPLEKATRSSPTLFEMMASEPEIHQPRAQIAPQNGAVLVPKPPPDSQALTMQRISEILSSRSPGNQFNDPTSSDIKLTLSSKEGLSVSVNLHRQILVAHSRFFSVKLSERWTKTQRATGSPYIVEIADCDDVEVYIDTLRLMYCKDLRKRLMKEDVPRVLGVLKVTFFLLLLVLNGFMLCLISGKLWE